MKLLMYSLFHMPCINIYHHHQQEINLQILCDNNISFLSLCLPAYYGHVSLYFIFAMARWENLGSGGKPGRFQPGRPSGGEATLGNQHRHSASFVGTPI